MRTNVLAGNHPWIDDWNVLVADFEAQSNYSAGAQADMGANRQRADADAHAAYLNTIRWYVSGDVNYANAATNILNRWSAAVNQIPSNTGLVGLPIMSFALAGELLRTYHGWQPADFSAFTNMMGTYLYPACNAYVSNQPCDFAHWTSWDAPNNAAIIAIGVLCDDTNKFNQAVNFFKSGLGTGAVSNAVPFLYPGPLGQCDESGRDQEHCTLGIADMGMLCQVAWNQGLDLYGFAGNRLLAGVEYVARYNLSHDVPYTPFNDCANDHLFYVSDNGRGRIDDRPVCEMFYNHYAVLKGLNAPNTRAMAQLYRPEHGSADHFGYGTLTYTLNLAASPYPPAPVPPAPTGLTAQGGISQVTLHWTPSVGDLAQGYNVLRSTVSGGPYASIATWSANTSPSYTDTSVTDGATYYYVVCAADQSGIGPESLEVSAVPVAPQPLPSGWTQVDVGVVTGTGSVQYAGSGDNTFTITGHGTGIGGTGDGGFNYTCRLATNNFTLIARLTANNADQMGLMLRGSLATNAAEVQFFMANNARQSVFAVRSSNGGNLNHYTSGDQFTYPPAWYKLSRSGNDFTAYQSDDGINWTTVQTATVGAIPASGYYAGLAINSGSATFDNVAYTNAAVTGTFAPPDAPTNLTAAAVAGNQIFLAWPAVANATGYNVKRSTSDGSGYAVIERNLPSTAFFDDTAAAGTNYFYVVSAINGGGESANSVPAVAIPTGPVTPLAPAGLSAAATTAQITLNWTASIGAASYNVKRSTVTGGPYTTIATGVAATYTDTNVVKGTGYFYVVSAVNETGESANSPQVAAALLNKLTGTIIGTSGSWSNLGNTKTNAFDGNLGTYFDSPDASGDWVGLDFGAGVSNVVGLIQYCPRATFADRMVGGVFQGANAAGFTNPSTLFTVTAAPAYSVMTPQAISVTNAFRYVRYLGPNNANCNVAEIEFDGSPAAIPPAAPGNLTASGGDGQVTLNWNATPGAFGYNVKQSGVSGGPYATIAPGIATTNYTDVTVTNGILDYFVVSAVNAGGESSNSVEAVARPVSTAPPRLNLGVNGGQLQFTWPADHTGWRLQAQTDSPGAGLGTNWITVAGSTNLDNVTVPVVPTSGGAFFRLVYP